MSRMNLVEQPPAEPTLRRRPVPVSEPLPAVRVLERRTDAQIAGQTVLAIPPPGAPDRPAPDVSEVDEAFDPQPTRSADLPDPGPWAAQFVQAAVEVGAGLRPPAQLVRWASAEVHAKLCRRAALAARLPRPQAAGRPAALVRSVRACRPRDGVCEASAVVLDRGRVRAVALRMEGLDGRWQVTELVLG